MSIKELEPCKTRISQRIASLDVSDDIKMELGMDIDILLKVIATQRERLQENQQKTLAPFMKPHPHVAKKNPVYQNRSEQYHNTNTTTKIVRLNPEQVRVSSIRDYPIARSILDTIPLDFSTPPTLLETLEESNLKTPHASPTPSVISSRRRGTITLIEALDGIPLIEENRRTYLDTIPISILKKMCKHFECRGHSKYHKKPELVQFMIDKIEFNLK